MPSPIPVVCDRCRAEGMAGEEAFADFGDLLDFEPVPRRPRADGWTPDLQRAFIAALAVTGSPRRAARAVGKAQYGAEQLRKAKGAEGFNAAWDRAMALAAEKGRHRLAAGISAAIEADARPDLVKAAPPPPDEPATQAEDDRACLETLIRKYMIKLQQEREARIEGRITEADHCLRQITWLEVAVDMTSGDGFKVLRDYRCGDYHLIDMAETPMARLLDAARRDHWAAAGDPPRPEHPIRRLLVDQGRFSTEPTEYTVGGIELSPEEQRARFEEQHARDAAAQVEWEAEARRDYERRRESEACPEPSRRAAHDQEPGPACPERSRRAGQPAPSGDRIDVTNSVRDGPQTSPMGPASKGDSSDSEGDSCSQLSPFEETEK
jgi:hypothetical protein